MADFIKYFRQTTEDTETLFSFEVHVEIVEELSVSCRLPAVSFRLLDFPTLIIHHVAPHLADKIRHKIDLESAATDPILSELKDRRPFQVQKGKSCLLKVNLEEFHTHLQTVPVYVMLIDLWPKKPKLVGSTTVSLKAAINKIYRDISRNGIAVPAFFREENTFEVYNLMGSVIAKIKLGYRLLSLGGALRPHIPHGSFLKRDSDKERNEAKCATDIGITPDVTRSPKMKNEIPIITMPAQPNKHNISVTKQDVHVQTDEHLKQRSRENNSKTDCDDDTFVTNTVCPPPLYYNFLSDTKQETVLVKGKSRDAADVENRLYIYTLAQPRATDTLVNKNYDVDFEYYDPGVLQTDGTVGCSSIAVQTDTRTPITAPMSDERAGAAGTNVDDAIKHFPLLNALLQELSSVANIKDVHKSISSRLPIEALQNEARKQKVNTKTLNVPSSRLTGNKQTDTRRVPSSVVRGQSAVIGLPKERPRFRKSNLTYKMTKTQCMRLEMNQKSKQGGERTRRPCVAWAEDVVGPSQELGDGRKPSSASRALGATYKLNHRQGIGTNTTVSIAENAVISSKQLILSEMQTEVEEAVTSGATQRPQPIHDVHREPQQVVLPSANSGEHRDPNLAQVTVRGHSPVGSTRSYKSQSSLDVYLPAMDGDSEEGSVSDKDIQGTDNDDPPESRGAYGYTGILPSVPATYDSLDSRALGSTSFDDQRPWKSREVEKNSHSSSSSSFHSIRSQSPQLHSNSSSGNKHKLSQSNSENSRSSNHSCSKNSEHLPQSRHSPMKVTKSRKSNKSSTTAAILGRAKVDISGSSSDISLPRAEASPLDLEVDGHHEGSEGENSNIYPREGSFAYSEDFVSAESHRSNSESGSSVGSMLERTS